MAIIGLAFMAGGSALAVNFRGFTAWHARKTHEIMAPTERVFRKVPPWSWFGDVDDDVRTGFQTGMGRFIAAVFAIAGFAVILVAVFADLKPASH